MKEKYGVLETSNPATCPLCNRPTVQHDGVTLCPAHGSRPFEPKSPPTKTE